MVWGGEFGRTPMNEARGGSTFLGRDHHPHAFTMWMAGGGVKPGIVYRRDGRTRLQRRAKTRSRCAICRRRSCTCSASIPYKFSYRYQGLNQRLIGPTNEGKIVRGLLA